MLTGEGAPGYALFVILEGTATVTSSDDPLRALGPGDFFGEIALLAGGRRTATVTATSPVQPPSCTGAASGSSTGTGPRRVRS